MTNNFFNTEHKSLQLFFNLALKLSNFNIWFF